MNRITRSIYGASALLFVCTAMVHAQRPLNRSDTLSVERAAIEYARGELLSPTQRPILVVSRTGASDAAWDSSKVAALSRALAPFDRNGAETVVCPSATNRCMPDASTQLVSVGELSMIGDSVVVTVSVSQASQSTNAQVSWRASEYVVLRRGGEWAVDHVRLKSAI